MRQDYYKNLFLNKSNQQTDCDCSVGHKLPEHTHKKRQYRIIRVKSNQVIINLPYILSEFANREPE